MTFDKCEKGANANSCTGRTPELIQLFTREPSVSLRVGVRAIAITPSSSLWGNTVGDRHVKPYRRKIPFLRFYGLWILNHY